MTRVASLDHDQRAKRVAAKGAAVEEDWNVIMDSRRRASRAD